MKQDENYIIALFWTHLMDLKNKRANNFFKQLPKKIQIDQVCFQIFLGFSEVSLARKYKE
jgi:hypothetical protein